MKPGLRSGGITNRDVCLYALVDTGGDVGFVATEDVAVRAFTVYPERFGLIRHPRYPDVDSVRVTLTDLRKAKYGSLVEGNKRKGWRITENGSQWMALNKKHIESALKSRLAGERRVSSGHLITSDRIRSARLARILDSDAFAKWRAVRRRVVKKNAPSPEPSPAPAPVPSTAPGRMSWPAQPGLSRACQRPPWWSSVL